MEQQQEDIKNKNKNNMNINEVNFPQVQEGDRVLWEDGNYYIYTNGTWILEEN